MFRKNSIILMLVYLFVILIWVNFNTDFILIYYIMLLGAMPFLARYISSCERYTQKGQVIGWFISLYGVVALIVTLKEIIVSPVAAVVFNSYFSLLFIVNYRFYDKRDKIFCKPFNAMRTIGITLTNMLFSFNLWGVRPVLSVAVVREYIVVAVLVGAAMWMFIRIRPKTLGAIVYGGAFIFAGICFGLTFVKWSGMPLLVMGLTNLYSIVLGIAMILNGRKEKDRLYVIGGWGYIAFIVLARGFGISWNLLRG